MASLWDECTLLAGAVAATKLPSDKRTSALADRARPRSLHLDSGLALHSALSAGATIVGIGAFGIVTGWELAPIAMGLAAVGAALFSSVDDPTIMNRELLIGLLIILPVGIVYQFAVLPAIHDFVGLMFSLLPVLLMLGAMFTSPKFGLRALGMISGFSLSLSLQPIFSTFDMATFLNTYFAAVLGPLLTLVILGLVRVIPVQRAASRLMRLGTRHLVDLMRAAKAPEPAVLASEVLDRASQLLPRLARIGRGSEVEVMNAMGDARRSAAIVQLMDIRRGLPTSTRARIDHVLSETAEWYDRLGVRAPQETAVPLVAALDALIAEALSLDRQEDRSSTTTALLRFRRAMFPSAAFPLVL